MKDYPLATRWPVPAVPATVSGTRKRVIAQLRLWGVQLDPDTAATLELLASETVTNAVRYAHGAEIEITVAAEPGTVLIAVTDGSTDMPEVRRAREEDESGRGLFLMQALATEWGCTTAVGGKTVWLTFGLPPRPGRPPRRADPRRSGALADQARALRVAVQRAFTIRGTTA